MASDKADKVILDFESRSAENLRRCGMYRYVEAPSTGVWCMSYKFDDGPVQRWHPGDATPRSLLEHVEDGGKVVAHNAGFERCIWNTTLNYDHWPRLEIKQMDCTMSRALAVHLPADLDTLGYVLGLPVKKDKEGHALMMKMSRPRKTNEDGSCVWWDSPEMVARLGAYCDQDVVVEALADERLPPLSAEERAAWELDQVINDRGIVIDAATVERAVAVLDVARERADARMRELTGGAVGHCTEALRIVEWLKGRGIPCESITKTEHDELGVFADCLGDEIARRVVELRAEAARNSTAKFRRMLDVLCDDGRARGLFNFHRASTGRWGGALIQSQNLPRVDAEKELPDVLSIIEIMATMI